MSSWSERASVIPGGSLTRSKKVFGKWAGYGCGAEIKDTDGKTYIDMLCALGAISIGYGGRQWSHSNSVTEAVLDGWLYSLPSALEVLAAEQFLKTYTPWASSIRFVKTGSEATHAAYRIAKAATGRKHVLMGDWAYHGWHEWCADPEFPFTHRFGNGGSIEPVMERDDLSLRSDVAAIFIEPHRWAPVDREWLSWLRASCDVNGILLVFDNMIYGGRWAKGGAEEYFGVQPDLACYGKAIGNGAPIACVVGNDALKQHGELVSGTYSGETASLAAVIDTAHVYQTQPVIETLWARGRQLARGLREALPLYRGDVFLEGEPVHQRVRFGDPSEGKRFSDLMASRGVLWHPDVVNVSFAHTEAQVERVVEAAMSSLAEMARVTA